jgi:PAS domain S-box-containing protein
MYRLFFQERYNPYRLAQELGPQLATTLDLDQLVIIVLDRLFETIPVTAINLFLKDETSGEFYLAAHKGTGLDATRWRPDHPIVRWLKREKRILSQRALNTLPQFLGLWQREQQELKRLAGDLYIPLQVKANLVGLLIVGKKLSEESYSADDHTFLAALASQVAVGIENARLYRQAQQEIAERKRMEAALLQSEEYFRALIENATDIVIVLNEKGTILYESPSFERVLGYSSNDLIGYSFYQFLHIEDQHTFMETLHYKNHDLRPNPATEIRFRHKDGAWRIIEAVSNNLLDDPVAAGIVVNLRDITERKYLEEQLRLAQKMEAVGRLAGGVAHDFNNILTVITGYSDLLLRRLDEDDAAFKPITEIGKAADRASALTRQLLTFSRKQIFHPQVVNLNEIIANMDSMLRRLIGEDIELITILESGLRPVKADATQIEQVIMNLTVNARDAMPKGGEIIIRTANINLGPVYTQYQVDLKPGPYVLLALTDTGQGIEAETLNHIFEPFFSTKEQGKGTGLGLATIYGIVQQSQGQIEVESEPGWGTRFNIYLPQMMDQPDTSEILEMPDVSLRGSETILLVEDEPSVRQLTYKILVENGYTVLMAADGQEALKLSERYADPIDLLLTDVVMPGGLSGRDLAKRLILQRPQTKTLYMSGYTDDAIVHHGVLEPGLAFLPKPFTSAELTHRVREALG